MARVTAHAREFQATVHMPRIGCGLAGERWELVEALIREELARIKVFVYRKRWANSISSGVVNTRPANPPLEALTSEYGVERGGSVVPEVH